jgi:hypothetical protein
MQIPDFTPFTTADFIEHNKLPKELAHDPRFTKPLHERLKQLGYRQGQRRITTKDGTSIVRLAWVRDPGYNVESFVAQLADLS